MVILYSLSHNFLFFMKLQFLKPCCYIKFSLHTHTYKRAFSAQGKKEEIAKVNTTGSKTR